MKIFLSLIVFIAWTLVLPGLRNHWNSAYAVFSGRVSATVCTERELPERTVESVALRQMAGSGNYTITLSRDALASEEFAAAAPQVGVAVEVVRCLPPGHLIRIATGKIEKVNDGFYLANVYVPSSVASMDSAIATQTIVMNRNLYWQPMQGDKVRILTPEIVRKQRVWPRFEFEVSELFETKQGDEAAYLSLSNEGRKKLVESFQQISKFEGRFLIEATSNGNGDSGSLQELTQIRAGTIANFIARVFEIDSARLVALGKGREQFASLFVPVSRFKGDPERAGASLALERIVIRILKE